MYISALLLIIACFIKPIEFALAGTVVVFLCGIFAILSSECSKEDNSHLTAEVKSWRSSD